MRDNMKPCNHNIDGVYKEVVVIGNGPSGMVTSFMLAGNVPYLKEIPDDLPLDDMLRARLSNVGAGTCLYETDLLQLAEGLEGRSHNPIPLLMDNLLRPCADMGITADSLIEWRFEQDKQIDHIVLGRGPPGGSWHTFPSRVLTLSPGAWLTLPPHVGSGGEGGGGGRVSASSVARYCKRYVTNCKLQKYFRSGVVVTSVSRGPQLEPCDRGCHNNYNYCVTGYSCASGSRVRYWCRRAAVCAGGCDLPNSHAHAHYALHTLADLTRSLDLLTAGNACAGVLIVGSGISAADAALTSRARRVHAALAHRRRTPLAALSAIAYPDYHRIYKIMSEGTSDEYYTSLPDHVVTDVALIDRDSKLPDKLAPKRVTLLDTKSNQIKEITVSLIAVLIGSRPDLFFLQTHARTTLDAKCKCTEERTDDNPTRCFFRNHWRYLKTVLGQTVQICKSRYLSYTEINGNNDTKCTVDDCRTNNNKCACKSRLDITNKLDDCYCKSDKIDEIKCYCKQTASYSNGLGFGLDPNKPVDGRNNPIAIDTSTHEVLNSPKGVYALGPVTGDNFIRFLPGGALAVVAHMHKEKMK